MAVRLYPTPLRIIGIYRGITLASMAWSNRSQHHWRNARRRTTGNGEESSPCKVGPTKSSYKDRVVYLRSTPHPVTVTIRIITFLVGNPYKPSFVTVTGWGVDPMYTHLKFNSSPLKSDRDPIGKANVFQAPFFRGELLNFRGVALQSGNKH